MRACVFASSISFLLLSKVYVGRCRKALASELQQRYFESDPQSKERRTLRNGFTAERVTLMQTTPNETETWSLVKAYTLQKKA